MIKFYCQHCGAKISADLSDAGVAANCPTCGQDLVVPQEDRDGLIDLKLASHNPNASLQGADGHANAFVKLPFRRINWIPALIFMCLGSLVVWLTSYQYTPFVRGKPRFDELFFALVLFLPRALFWAILHYRCWLSLPDRHRATSPSRAVGFLFVPFFNFYWAFVSWPKLSQGLVDWQRELGISPRSTRGLGLTYSILFVCAWTFGLVPGVGILIGIAQLVIFILFYQKTVSCINEILSMVVVDAAPNISKKRTIKLAAISATCVLLVGLIIAVFSSKSEDSDARVSGGGPVYSNQSTINLSREKMEIERDFRRYFPNASYTDLDRDYSDGDMVGFLREAIRGGEALASVYPEKRAELRKWQSLKSRMEQYKELRKKK